MFRTYIVILLAACVLAEGQRSRRAVVDGIGHCGVGMANIGPIGLLPPAPPGSPGFPAPPGGQGPPGGIGSPLPSCPTFVDQNGYCWIDDTGIDEDACVGRYGQSEYNSFPRGVMK